MEERAKPEQRRRGNNVLLPSALFVAIAEFWKARPERSEWGANIKNLLKCIKMQRPFSAVQILNSLKIILPHLKVTLAVVLLVIIFGSLFAFFLTWLKLSRFRILRRIAEIYVYVIRCTPAIILLFLVFYGLPKLAKIFFNANIYSWSKIVYVVIALSLLYAASLSEIIRSAYESVGKVQLEGGLSLGMSKFQTIFKVIFPQAFVIAIPNLGNSFISLLKEGSLAYTIGLIDVMGAGNLIIARNYGGYGLETYIALTIIYWTLTLIIEGIFKILEKHFSLGRVNVV